jgi:hypothetical protein
MGALAQPRHSRQSEPIRKPVSREKIPLDAHGRDPKSPVEILRQQSDYEKGSGFSPFFHAFLADLPRLLGGSAVSCWLVMTVLRLSLGAPRGPKQKRSECTPPISTAELAELCCANIRDIQLRLSELEERGIIVTKKLKTSGAVKYSISLKYRDWREIEDYAVWKRRQTVTPIDAGDGTQDSEQDEELKPISSEATLLFKGPRKVRPGRATTAVKFNTGVREFVFENHSDTVEASCTAVVQSGRLVVSATFQQPAVNEKQTTPVVTAVSRKRDKPDPHPLTPALSQLFDPLLARSAARLLSPDEKSLQAACVAVGEMSMEFLAHFLMKPGGRGERSISGPAAVPLIVAEARKNWQAVMSVPIPPVRVCSVCGGPHFQDGLCCAHLNTDERKEQERAERILRARAILANPKASEVYKASAREVLANLDE